VAAQGTCRSIRNWMCTGCSGYLNIRNMLLVITYLLYVGAIMMPAHKAGCMIEIITMPMLMQSGNTENAQTRARCRHIKNIMELNLNALIAGDDQFKANCTRRSNRENSLLPEVHSTRPRRGLHRYEHGGIRVNRHTITGVYKQTLRGTPDIRGKRNIDDVDSGGR
jgi:hypothetical protein